MPDQRNTGGPRRALARDAERRSWLSSAAGGIGVSVLGVALATSLTSTTSAQPTSSPSPAATSPAVGGAGLGGALPGRGRLARSTPSTDPLVVAAYRGSAGAEQTTALREAIVAERAAQRAEELAKKADEVSRAGRTATSKARQKQLDADGAATQAKGEQLAKEALARAAAARLAAEKARLAAEAAAADAAARAAQEAQAAQDAQQAARDAQQAAQQASQQASSRVPDPAAPTADAPAPPVAPSLPVVANGQGVAPVSGAVVGAGFGEYGLWSRYHTGLDFRAGFGVTIRAVKSGVVLYAGNSGNWSGNHVAIQHADGMTTMSSHMSSMRVQAGQRVQAGEVIGYVGSTGRAFGAHLHFELYPVGVKYGDVYQAVNPVPWLRAAGVITR